MNNNAGHIGGRNNTCHNCGRSCLFFTKVRKLTRYAFSCGYLEVKGALTLGLEHHTFHVKGFTPDGKRVWESFDTVKPARQLLARNGVMPLKVAA